MLTANRRTKGTWWLLNFGVASVAGHTESYTPLQHHSPGEAAMDASYCFFSLPKQIQLGLELHCPIRRRIIHFTPNTPMGLSILITVTAGSQGWETTKTSQNLLRHTLFLYSRSQGLWLAYHKDREVLRLGRGSATCSSCSGPSSSTLENPISSWNWGQRKRRIFLGNGHVKVTPTVTGENEDWLIGLQ